MAPHKVRLQRAIEHDVHSRDDSLRHELRVSFNAAFLNRNTSILKPQFLLQLSHSLYRLPYLRLRHLALTAWSTYLKHVPSSTAHASPGTTLGQAAQVIFRTLPLNFLHLYRRIKCRRAHRPFHARLIQIKASSLGSLRSHVSLSQSSSTIALTRLR